MLRACECLGVQDVWLIRQPHQPEGAARLPDGPHSPAASEYRHSMAGATGSAASGEDPAQWALTIRSFVTAQQCIAAVREEQCALWCTALSQSAEVLPAVLGKRSIAKSSTRGSSSLAPVAPQRGDDQALARRLAVAFSGSEAEGVSQEMIDAADKLVYLPLHGGRHTAARPIARRLAFTLVLVVGCYVLQWRGSPQGVYPQLYRIPNLGANFGGSLHVQASLSRWTWLRP